MEIVSILEHKKVHIYLEKHGLIEQYKKAKNSILKGDLKSVDFKKRQPYKTEKYYFRINKQFRAFGYFEGNVLKIFEINNHQND